MSGTGLYVHIPVCEQRCRYCSFYSTTAQKLDWDKYRRALFRQLDAMETGRLPEVNSVYFGGGTPSLAPVSFFSRVLEDLADRLSMAVSPEITVEVNPEHGTRAWFQGVAEAGVNRVSIGLQSMDDVTLTRLGRIHTAARSVSCLTEAVAVFRNISVDLITGIQGGPTPGDEMRNLTPCIDQIAHVSIYMLEGDRLVGLQADSDTAAAAYLEWQSLLDEQGLHQYEISNYAREGYTSRHNTHYWTGDPYLGLGPSAHSLIPPVRMSVAADLDAFLRGQAEWHKVRYSENEFIREMLMLALRRTEGVSFSQFRERYREDVKQTCAWMIDRFPGLVTMDGDRMRLTTEGMLLSNEIFQEILFPQDANALQL